MRPVQTRTITVLVAPLECTIHVMPISEFSSANGKIAARKADASPSRRQLNPKGRTCLAEPRIDASGQQRTITLSLAFIFLLAKRHDR